MARRLATFVHVHTKDKDGNVTGTQVFGPDDDVPSDVAKELGDHVWESDEDATDLDGDGRDDQDPEKPAGNASLEAWQEYAESKGFDHESMGRDEIRDHFA